MLFIFNAAETFYIHDIYIRNDDIFLFDISSLQHIVQLQLMFCWHHDFFSFVSNDVISKYTWQYQGVMQLVYNCTERSNKKI